MKSVENLSCKKTSFRDERGALDFIEKLKKTSKRQIVPTRAYLCPYCLKWHLTHLQGGDLRGMEFRQEKLKKIIDGLQNENNSLKAKVSELEETIKCMNKAILEFRLPKIKQFKSKK